MIHVFSLLVSAHFLKISGQYSSDTSLVISKMIWLFPHLYNIKNRKWKKVFEVSIWMDIQGTVHELT